MHTLQSIVYYSHHRGRDDRNIVVRPFLDQPPVIRQFQSVMSHFTWSYLRFFFLSYQVYFTAEITIPYCLRRIYKKKNIVAGRFYLHYLYFGMKPDDLKIACQACGYLH